MSRRRIYFTEEERIRAVRERARARYRKLSQGRSDLKIAVKEAKKGRYFDTDEFEVSKWHKRKSVEEYVTLIEDTKRSFRGLQYRSYAEWKDGVLGIFWLVRLRDGEEERDVRNRVVRTFRERLPFEKYICILEPHRGYDNIRALVFYTRLDRKPEEGLILDMFTATRK